MGCRVRRRWRRSCGCVKLCRTVAVSHRAASHSGRWCVTGPSADERGPEETLPMAYRAVVFDLFGTLVGNFSVQEYDRVLRRMAEALSTPYAEFCQHAGRNYYQREIGQFASLEESIARLCREQ